MIQAKIIFESEIQGRSQLSPGVYEGATFTGVSQEGDYYDFSFSYKGNSIRKRIFPPTGANPKENQSPKEALEMEQTRNIQFITRILHAVLPSDEFIGFGAKTYPEYMAKAFKTLNASKGALVNLLVVPQYKDAKYSDLPSYGNFVEKYEEGVPTTLKMSDKDKKRLEELETKKSGSNDLPF